MTDSINPAKQAHDELTFLLKHRDVLDQMLEQCNLQKIVLVRADGSESVLRPSPPKVKH